MFSKLMQSFHRKALLYRYSGLPDFIILGAQKAGTTALFDYLNQHPGIFPNKTKEVHFFDRPESRSKGSDWYLRHFPNPRQKESQARKLGYRPIAGEATGAYIFHPNVPKLLDQFCREFDNRPKFIILLRNPISRALSHYAHNHRRSGREHLSFHEAIISEESRIAEDVKKIKEGADFHPTNLLRYSYASRGLYMEQIERWLSYFQPDDFFFLDSNKLLKEPNTAVNQIFAYLNLPAFDIGPVKPKHVGKYKYDISTETHKFLVNKFQDDSSRLFDFLGQKLWSLN